MPTLGQLDKHDLIELQSHLQEQISRLETETKKLQEITKRVDRIGNISLGVAVIGAVLGAIAVAIAMLTR